jgi:hypothetical protein
LPRKLESLSVLPFGDNKEISGAVVSDGNAALVSFLKQSA